jgi:sporulation protein YlmC with PRC-barrel domain
MKSRTTFLITTLLFAAMLFAACGPASESDRTPGVTEPALTDDGLMTETITGTQEISPTVEMTEPAMTEPAATEPGATTEATEVTEQPTEAVTEVVPPTGFVDPNRLTNLMDFPVYNENAEQIGEVGDMVLNPQTQEVDYVILELGGFLGLGEAQVPVPWSVLQIIAEGRDRPEDDSGTGNFGDLQNAFVLMVGQDVVDNAPEIDLDDTFSTFCGTVIGWDAEIQSYWASHIPTDEEDADAGTATPEAGTPAAQETATSTPEVSGTPVSGTPAATDEVPATGGMTLQGVILATHLIGADIQAQDNPEEVGTVDDVMVDIDTAHIRFLFVTFSFDDVESRIPLPAALLGCNPDEQTFVLLTDAETIRTAPTFADNEFPDTRNPDWDVDFLDYWADVIDMEDTDAP